MKASVEPGLDEKYIIPIARELATALRHVHDASVIHRDIKCGNVLISEDGRLELCDFGVAGRLENGASKRSTIIGTPYWMAPEMHGDVDGYGVEIDVWAYGCTIYEMATGMPPYHKFHPSYLRQVLESEPRLDEDAYSAPLCDFVAFLLRGNPEDRPTAKQIVEHPYIANTSARFPTNSLRELIDRYIQWERKGGQRMSLFNAMGAAAPQLGGHEEGGDEWIFSTTDTYDQDYERRFSQMPQGIATMDFASSVPVEIDLPANPSPAKMTPLEKAKEEQRAQRGERKLNKLFDPHSDPYDYNSQSINDEPAPMSDLPLRDFSDDRAANRETLIDLDTSGLEIPDYTFDFSDMPTVKGSRKSNYNFDDGQTEDPDFYNIQANDPRRETKDWKFPAFSNTEPNRETKDWTFPTFTTTAPEEDSEAGDTGTIKRATKDWTFPGFARDDADVAGGEEEDISELANRRTMDWTFATAGNAAVPAEAASPEPDFHFTSQNGNLAPGYRPHVTRTATEPLGSFNDFLHPPPGSLDAEKIANRESTPMIDLDFGQDIRPPSLNLEGPSPPNEDAEDALVRASSPLSYTYSTSSIGPFDLEQDPVVREDDLRRYSHKRQQGSVAGPSVAERRASSRYLQTGSPTFQSRSRGASFDSTASSNPDDGGEESGYSHEYNRSMGAKMREQLRAGLQRSFSQRHIRQLTSDSYGDTDTGSEAYAQEHGAYDTDGSMPEERTVMRTARTFPEPHAPAAGAMREGASQEELYEALDEQFAALMGGLEFTSGIYRRREDELYPEEASERSSSVVAGVTSEEERELAGFSSVAV